MNERIEKLLLAPVVFILLYTTWVWSGIRLSFHKPVLWLAGLLLVMLFTVPAGLAERSQRLQVLGRNVRRILSDPFFYSGLLFLIYLCVQWWNTGRTQVLDAASGGRIYSPPPHPGWPSSFKAKEALQMLEWFFPAWVLVLTLRTGGFQKATLQRLLYLIVCNAAVLSLFGLVQYASGTKSVYWLTKLNCRFFASFGYTNHAAAFFVLTGALAIGLLFRELFKPAQDGRTVRVSMLAVATVVCLTGANMSLSRAGVILAWSLIVFASIYGLKRGWAMLRPAGRANMLAATIGVVGIFSFLVVGFGRKEIAKEFRNGAKGLSYSQTITQIVYAELGPRPMMVAAAWQLWKDNPVLGVGGWGFRYLLTFHVPHQLQAKIEKQGSGWANVHCDPIQFLLEFGIVGFGLMLLSVTILFAALRQADWRSSLLWMSLTGLTLVVIHSLIDLPFRCPAVLYTWLVILAILPGLTSRGTTTKSNNLSPAQTGKAL